MDTLRTILKQGAVDLGEAGVDNNYGYGRLDALAALNLLMQDSLPPTFVSSLPVNNSLSKERSVYVLSAQDDRSGVDLGTSSLSLLREGAPLSGSVLGQFGGVLRLTLGTPIPAGPASDGLYQLRATLKDRTGNTTTQDVFFTLDSTAPELTLNPVPAVVGESGLILAGSLSDTNGVSLSINGVPVTSLPGAFTHPVTLAPGGNQLSVQLTDPVGNTTQQTVAVAWDNQGPALPTFYPPLGGFAASLSTTVGARVTDAFSAVDFSASVLLVNGESCGPLLQTGDLLTCAPGGPLPKGQSRAELTVRDEWGNETFEDWTFIVDPDPPVLTLGTVPAATRNDTVLVSGTVQEDNLLSLTVGGAPATLAAGQFLYTATLVAGGNVLDVIATDKAGNVATLPLTVIKDNTPPMLVLNTPATDMTTNQAALVVSGLTDASLVTVGGVVASLSGGQFSLSKTLAEGPNTISVAAHDAAGNVTLITRQVTLDTTAPTFTQPLPQALTTRNSPLPLTVFAEGATQVEAGGLLFAVVGGQANLSLPVAEGLNQFTVTARDTAGNKLPVPLTVLRLSSGNTPTPQLIWSSQPAATSASSVVVMAVAVGVGVDPAFAIGGAPALAAQVTPTDQCAPDPCPGVTVWLFSASVVLQEGANLIPVTTGAATPPAQTLAITRDTQPPALGSLSPGFGAVVKGPVTLTGQTEAGATLSWLYGLTTTGTSGIFNLPLPPDVLAVNTSLLLTDTLGNQAALPVVFAVDNTPPAVLAVSPASGSMVGAGVVRVSVTCEGCTRVTYLSKSATVTAGVAELDVVLPQSQVDSPIEVTDEAGNVTTVPYLLLREVLTGDTTLALSAGWNLVSLGETSLAQLGVELGPGAWVLAYDPLTGYTVPGGMAQASRGYFVLLPQGGTVHVDLPAELVAKTVALAPGWNLAAFSYLGQGAGLSSENLTVQQGENVMPLAQAMQQGLVSGLFSFNGSGYDENAPMNWLSGFWIFAESALSLSAP